MCSPLTLFAVLAVVRQAVESFRTERTASEILDVLGTFRKQWDAFSTKMDALGRNLTTTTRAFDELAGARTRQLERQLDRIDDLQRHHALDVTDDGDAALAGARTPGVRWLSAPAHRPDHARRARDLRVRPGRAVDRLRRGDPGADRRSRCSASGS